MKLPILALAGEVLTRSAVETFISGAAALIGTVVVFNKALRSRPYRLPAWCVVAGLAVLFGPVYYQALLALAGGVLAGLFFRSVEKDEERKRRRG